MSNVIALRWITKLVLIVSTLLLAASAVTALRTWELHSRGAPTTGRVVALEKQFWVSARGPWVYYAPRVRFRTEEGQQHEFASSSSDNPPAWRLGDNIPVIYLRQQPDRAEVGLFWSLWERPFVWSLTGAALLLVGLFMLYVVKVGEREERMADEGGSGEAPPLPQRKSAF